jgi:hypothetical protein
MESKAAILVTYADGEQNVFTLYREDDNIRVDAKRCSMNMPSELLTRCGLVGYIQTLGLFILSSGHPVKAATFSFPAFPPLRVTPAALADESLQDAILEAARITSDSWFADFPAGYESETTDN